MSNKHFSPYPLVGLGLLGLIAACTGPAEDANRPVASNSQPGISDPQPPTDTVETTAVLEELAQVAYIKASNTGAGDNFGAGGTLAGDAVALSKDGGTLAIGAPFESGGVAGVGGDETDESVYGAGAVYVFTRQGDGWVQQAYVKASNPGLADNFGFVTMLSADGNTMAVSSHFEAGGDSGVEADQNDDSIPQAGAVYVFTRNAGTWTQQAYLKPSNMGEPGQGAEFSDGDQFGAALAMSDDGNTLAVSAITEDSGSPGIDGDQSDNSERSAGAVYLFRRAGGAWTQEAYIKASNPGGGDYFGYSLGLSAAGNRLAAGSYDEDGSLAGTNEQQDDDVFGTGAVYVFDHDGDAWNQTAYLKASNSERGDSLGVALAISDDGNTLVVTALDEDGVTTGVNNIPGPDQEINLSTGAVYVYVHRNGRWAQQAYIKASNTDRDDSFGARLALSGDGNTLAASAQLEDGAARGIDGNQDDNTAAEAGAVYLFTRTNDAWSQQAYVKASNTDAFDEFGSSLSLTRDGSLMAVGAQFEDSANQGSDAGQDENSAFDSGAVYLFAR